MPDAGEQKEARYVTTHRTSKVAEATEELLTTEASADHPLTQETTVGDHSTTETHDTDVHEAAAIDAGELKKTPCYAYIQGNCTAGTDCARSHKKQDIATVPCKM